VSTPQVKSLHKRPVVAALLLYTPKLPSPIVLVHVWVWLQIIESLERASKVPKPPVSALFTDVYKEMPWHLKEQLQGTLALIKRHPHLLPPDMAAE
jgi:hypothetical protein